MALALRAFSWALLVFMVGVEVVLRLSNPDMAETRFTLTFWQVHLAGLVAVLLVIGTLPPGRRSRRGFESRRRPW